MATEPRGNPQMQGIAPSDWLMTVFRTCSRDPGDAIRARLTEMLHMFELHLRNHPHPVPLRCCRAAAVWYYRILENLIRQEQQQRPGLRDASAILGADLPQRCLVACCVQISTCLNDVTCDLPGLLPVLHLTSYHFWGVIELVLRAAERNLPPPAFDHLSQLEDNILERLAWTSGSPLWVDVTASGGRLPTCRQVMPPAQLEEPGLQMDAAPSAANRPQRSNYLQLFARKVYSLSSRRLKKLCSSLDVAQELQLKMWTCFEHSLVHFTSLMLDRHLDQLLMCAIYIIARITNMEIPFKRIMSHYKSEPHTDRRVCCSVLIPGTNRDNNLNNNGFPTPDSPWRRGNLIDFYNQVYITNMRPFAVQFAAPPQVDTPRLTPFPSQRTRCPRRHQSSTSITISPFPPERHAPRTPGLSYVFNSSSRERLREINNMIRSHTAGTGGDGDGGDGGDGGGGDGGSDGGPASKRPRLDAESALQRRLTDVVKDRAANENQL